jgi:hypothetical protein
MDRTNRRDRLPFPVWGLVVLTLGLAGCSPQMMSPGPADSVAPQLSVERFLQASNDRDLGGMARLFGTYDGPVANTGGTFGCFFKKIGSWFGGESCVSQQDVEVRMSAISNILQHEDYRIVGEQQVAGREHPATQVSVDIMRADATVRGVPFVVVRSADGQWLVEIIDLQRVMAGG